jgi:hypothetical protein
VAEAEGNRTPLTEVLGHNGVEDRAAHQDGYASSGDAVMISTSGEEQTKGIVMHEELIQALRSVQVTLDDPVDQLDARQEQLADRVLDDIEALLQALSADER